MNSTAVESDALRRHLIITGTGRAGTTFLVKLLTLLGQHTGFSPETWNNNIYAPSHAGLEANPSQPDAPYILKSPEYCHYLDTWLGSRNVVIDHVIVPQRDLHSAAESRRAVSRNSAILTPPGGLWGTLDPEEQEAVLQRNLTKLFRTLHKWNIPHTLLEYPRLVQDPEYLYNKLTGVFPDMNRDSFFAAFQSVVNPALIHDYLNDDVQ